MRAFVAIELPGSIREALAREQARFRAVCPDARWTRPEGIHLTLKFLGDISAQQEAQVKRALGQMERFEKFTLRAQGFGFFPDARRPRVFWAGLEAPPDLARLAAQVENALAPLGFPPENRPFKPHLTMARFKLPGPQRKLESLVAVLDNPLLGSFEVSEFFLWESRLMPGGAEYHKVARFPQDLSVPQ
ncbi:MAG TPA: RNA 2',3'-cyclic phosphodiesterase [Terriglobia bacterium]|nr:RNA 2',3'-cyclic phosphodiesterase [Terriglobia bacterium]